MTDRDQHLSDVLSFDALDSAERMTGSKIEDTAGPAFGLGFLLLHAKHRETEKLLRARSDVWDGCGLAAYLACIEANGFYRILEDKFRAHDVTESFFIYAHPEGLLLTLTTYGADRVNGGNVYYNWRPAGDANFQYTSSGHFIAPDFKVWAGDHDCREALIFNLDRLRANGAFVTPWVERPWLWLLSYEDCKVEGYDSDAINEERINRLPQWVRDFVGGPA